MSLHTPRPVRAFSGVILALAALVTPVFSGIAHAQSPSHIYELNGSYTDSLGGSSLTPGTSAITATGVSFPANSFLSLSNGFADPTNYSIEMYFHLNTSNSYRKILDFKNRNASDDGLYATNSMMHFWGGGISDPFNLDANSMNHLVLTRNGATNEVNLFMNGSTTPLLTFVDNRAAAVPTESNNILYFFTDDPRTGGNESVGGFVDYIRTYDTALTGSQARDVYNANVIGVVVPEPSTFALLGGVSSLAGGILLRRRRKSA